MSIAGFLKAKIECENKLSQGDWGGGETGLS